MSGATLSRTRLGRRKLLVPAGLIRLGLVVLAVTALWLLWSATAIRVPVTVDGVAGTIYTHRRDVGALLPDLGVDLHPADRVFPALDTRLREVEQVVVERAGLVQIVVDGRTVQTASWGDTPRAVLADAKVLVDAYDSVMVNSVPLALDDPLPARRVQEVVSEFAPGHAWQRTRQEPLQLRVVRALPVVVDDGSLPFTVRTTASTVGEALRQAEITLYLGDEVVPSLGSAVTTGLRVTIQRSLPVALQADGRLVKTRTRGETVADALAEMRVGVSGLDRVVPALDVALYDGIKIDVTRIREEIEIEEEVTPFETVYTADGNVPIDTQQVTNPGAEGITRTRYRVRLEDGEEVARVLEDSWVAQEPEQRVVAYGQQITPRTMTAADGTQITYWRHIRMSASSYSANTAGVSTSSPTYGRTYTGAQMRFGIVAVDPSVIPLRSRVYVPGYGMGDALDTGGAIRARRIDLGYDDSNLVLWNRWVDVYLLWPPPPAGQITWVLPNWPLPPE